MAKPAYDINLFSPEELQEYKRFQGLGQQYADEFASYTLGAREREAKAAVTNLPAPVEEAEEPVLPQSFTEEEVPEELPVTEEYDPEFLLTERERLEREASRPVEEDFFTEGEIVLGPKPVEEEAGLPATTPQLKFMEATPEKVKAGADVFVKPPSLLGAPEQPSELGAADEATRFYAGLDDASKRAWQAFTDELIAQGADLKEAEARASQLVAGIVLAPREIGEYATKVEGEGAIDVEKFAEGEFGLGDVFGRQPLESTSQFKLRQSREARGAQLRKVLEEQVNRDLGAWQVGRLQGESENFYVAMKDPTAGGIDADKVEEWKKKRLDKLISQGQEDIRIKARDFLLGTAAAEGRAPAIGSPEYQEISNQAGEVANIWLEEVDPEKYSRLTGTEKGTVAKAAEYVLTDKGEGGQLYESKTGAALRGVTGLIRYITQPAIKALSYDVNPDGSPVDPEDLNYKFAKGMEELNSDILDVTGRSDAAAAVVPLITGAMTLGTSFYTTSARGVGSGLTKKPELSSGNYLNDVAFSIAIGRSLADDYSDLIATQHLYNEILPEYALSSPFIPDAVAKISPYIPFAAGIATEVGLPVLPTTVVGGAISKLGGGIGKLAPNVGRVVTGFGNIIDSPISEVAAPLARRSIEVSRARAVAKAFGIDTKGLNVFDINAKPVSDYVAETLAPKIADIILEGKTIPPDFAAIADEVGTDIIAINRALGKEIDLTDIANLQETLSKTKIGSYVYKVIADDILAFLNSKTVRDYLDSARDIVKEEGVLGRDVRAEKISRILVEEGSAAAREARSTLGAEARARVAPVETGFNSLQELNDLQSRLRIKVLQTGKLSEAELRQLLDSYATTKVYMGIEDGAGGLLSGINKRVADLIVADRLAEDLAKSSFNDWVFISPTAIAKVDRWNKVSSKVDNSVKRILYGKATDKDIAEMVDEATNTIKLPEAQKTEILSILSRELGSVAIEKNTYWSKVVDKILADSPITIDELSSVVNVVRTKVARDFIGTSVVIPRRTGKLTERAEVPMVRRIPLARGLEDIGRAVGVPKAVEVLQNGLAKASKTRIAQRIGLDKTAGALSRRLNKTIETAPLPIANALKTLSAQINNLPQELIGEFRTIINSGKTGPEALSQVLDNTIISGLNVVEGSVKVDEVANLYWDLIRRFFGIKNLPDYKVTETFLAPDGPIRSVLDRLAEEGNISIDKLSGLTPKGRPILLDIMDEIINSTRGMNSEWINRGLKTLTDDAISDLFISKILDVKKDMLVEDFAINLATKNPELVISVNRTEKANLYREINTQYIEDARDTYSAIERATPEGQRWGNPKSVGVSDGIEIIERDTRGLGTYERSVNKLVRAAIVEETSAFVSSGKPWADVEKEVYFRVTNSIIKNGIDNSEKIMAELSNAYEEIFNTDKFIQKIQSNLRTKYPKVNWDDYTPEVSEVTFIPPKKRIELKDAIIEDPARFTDDAAFSGRINEINEEIGTAVSPKKKEILNKIWDDGVYPSDEIRVLAEEHRQLQLSVGEPTMARPVEDIGINILVDRTMKARMLDIEDEIESIVQASIAEEKAVATEARTALLKERSALVKQIIERGNVAAFSETKQVTKFTKNGNFVDVVRNNTALVTRAEIESILELSVNNVKAKLYTLGFDFKSGAGGYEAINAQMKSVANLKVFLDPDSAKLFSDLTENNKFLNAALEDLGASNKDAADFVASRVGWTLGTLRRNAIGGMLGGIYTLTTRFLGNNNFTAPVIGSVTAPTYVGKMMLNIPKAFVRPVGRAVQTFGEVGTGAVAGGAIAFATTFNPLYAMAGAAAGAALGRGAKAVELGSKIGKVSDVVTASSYFRRGSNAIKWLTKGDDIIVTPSGKVYTNTEINSIFRRNVYKLSQYDFDFSSAILQDIKRAADVNEAGYTPNIIEQLRRSYGPFTRNSSFWNIVGSEADYVFRETVFKEALRRGATEAEGANLARNVLLDYSQVTDWEKKLISSWMLFYSFMRQSTVEAIQALGRPNAAAGLNTWARIQKGTEDNLLKRNNAYVGKYAGTRMAAWTDGDVYEGYKTGFYGPANPVFEGYNRVLGGAYTAYDAAIKGKLVETAAAGAYNVVTSQPWFEFGKTASTVLAASPNAPYGYYPATSLAVHATLGDMPMIKDKYDLKPILNKDGTPRISAGEPTWNGHQWQFGSREGRLRFERDTLQAVLFGYERATKDWVIATSIANGVDPEGAELKRFKDGNVYLYHAGLQTPIKSPEWLRAQEELAKQMSRELRLASEGKDPNSLVERIKAGEEGE